MYVIISGPATYPSLGVKALALTLDDFITWFQSGNRTAYYNHYRKRVNFLNRHSPALVNRFRGHLFINEISFEEVDKYLTKERIKLRLTSELAFPELLHKVWRD